MKITQKYIVTDILQTGFFSFLVSYWLVTRSNAGTKIDLLEFTEELVWFIAKLFVIGIALSLCFLLSYFFHYLCNQCIDLRKYT